MVVLAQEDRQRQPDVSRSRYCDVLTVSFPA